MHLKMSFAKRRPFCPGEDELNLAQDLIPIIAGIHRFMMEWFQIILPQIQLTTM